VRGGGKLDQELAPYRGEKGNLKFPLDEPMPYALIKRVIEARLADHRQRLATKSAKKNRAKTPATKRAQRLKPGVAATKAKKSRLP
jgi:hypothetical protein